ncbi:MAG: hypothetical protein LBD59_04430, partial [Prevotellaceae bacterium]|nr:hypothetical protein [Prevotellaceae bacterium]
VETHGVRLCEDCLRRRCASQCRDGARPVSTVFAGQEIATQPPSRRDGMLVENTNQPRNRRPVRDGM